MIEILTSGPAIAIYTAIITFLVKTYVPIFNPLVTELVDVINRSVHSKEYFKEVATAGNNKRAFKHLDKKL